MSNILVILVSLLQNPSKAADIVFRKFRLEMTDTHSSKKRGLKNGKISCVTMEPSLRKEAKTRAKC